MAYATLADIQNRMTRQLSDAEQTVCTTLMEDAETMIDAYNSCATLRVKRLVTCRMVIRALGDGETSGVPIGATQGSMSGLGYAQSWTISNGSSGELYLSKREQQLLGRGNKIGSYSPLEDLGGAT